MLKLILFLILSSCISCVKTTDAEPSAPDVTPFVSALGSDSVIVSWKKEEDPARWKYHIMLCEDSTSLKDLTGTNYRYIEDIREDTSYMFKELKPSTQYKVKLFIRAINGGMRHNESWPPLVFTTLEK